MHIAIAEAARTGRPASNYLPGGKKIVDGVAVNDDSDGTSASGSSRARDITPEWAQEEEVRQESDPMTTNCSLAVY